MTDTTLTPNEPVPAEPKPLSIAEMAEKEGEAGAAAAEANAERFDKALEDRKAERMNAREIASAREAVGNKKFAEAAEKVRGMVEELPPPGPGLPQVDPAVLAATMDPNNPVLNPDMSRLGATRSLPPGAHVPEPVLPPDTIQTQFASKPPTEAHGEEGMEVAKGLPEPLYPPAGSQPTIELTEEEREKMEAERSGEPRQVTDQSGAQPTTGETSPPPGEQPGQTP